MGKRKTKGHNSGDLPMVQQTNVEMVLPLGEHRIVTYKGRAQSLKWNCRKCNLVAEMLDEYIDYPCKTKGN